jgi:DNA-binding CsgD family transcriptional regulator
LGVHRAPALTKREAEVFKLRARGFTNGEAGCMLGMREQTARNHMQHVYQKLGVRNIVEACLAMGWLDVPAE